MLALTDAAVEAVKSLAGEAALPASGGLRIAAVDADEGLELSLAEEPSEDDLVLTGEGITVFLDPVAAQVLDDKVLDLRPVTGEDGREELRFAIGPQEPGPGEPGPEQG